MNVSLGLLPSRSLLRSGLRLCRGSSSPSSSTTARTTSATSAYLSTYTFPRARPHPSPWSPTCARSLWPSPATQQHHSPSQLLLRWASSKAGKEPILTHYEDLPLEYRDKVGLAFRDTDLSPAEVEAIFDSPRPKTAAANRLLRILHGRRVAGTLDDPAFAVNTAAFTPEQHDAALRYLRETVEIDEVINAGLRAEDELAQLEKDLAEDPAEAKSLRDDSKDGSDAAAAPEVVVKPDPVYGYSALDAIRAKNQARNAAEEARLAKEALERGEDPAAAKSGPLALNIKRPAMTARMQKWQDEGAASDLQEPSELSFFERILPSAAVVLLLLGALSAFAMVYSPPTESERLFPEVRASVATVGTIVALNVAVCLAWRIPPLWRFLNTRFVLVHGAPRALTMITANFSHYKFFHLATNMFGLWFVGTSLHDEVGRANFLAVYLGSGSVGLLGSLVTYTLRGVLTVSTIGASGAVFGVAAAYFWTHRYDYFKVFGFPPEPMRGVQGLGFIGLILGLHVYSMLKRGPQTIDITTHLFGMAAGYVGIELIHARMRKQAGRSGGGDGKAVVEKKREDLVKDAPSPLSNES